MKIFTGKVVSNKMEKTATVAVERVVPHPLYKKRTRKIKKYHVHDELGTSIGQSVRFTASKPYSKLKKWKIIGIVRVYRKNDKNKEQKVNKKKKNS